MSVYKYYEMKLRIMVSTNCANGQVIDTRSKQTSVQTTQICVNVSVCIVLPDPQHRHLSSEL